MRAMPIAGAQALAVVSILLACVPAAAQESSSSASSKELEALRSDTELLRQQIKTLSQLVEALSAGAGTSEENAARIRALEEQIHALEREIAALKAAVSTEQPPPPAPGTQPSPEAPPAPAPPSTGGESQASAQLPDQGGPAANKLNPAVGVIGNFIAAGGQSRGGSDSIAPQPSFTLQESEVSFQAAVDPYARADFFLAIGEESIEVEEGYVTFPTVPGGLAVKVGRMRANFGKLNTLHNHTLPWVDRPLAMFNLLGGSTQDPDTGIKDAGVSVSWLAPTEKLFLEATGEVFRGESGALFQATRRQDVSFVGHVRTYGDLTEATNLEGGLSYARGHNDVGSDFLTELWGLDLMLRWKPLARALYRSLTARTELIWSRRAETEDSQDAFGAFVSVDYRLDRRWFVGARYDLSDRARQDTLRDRGASAVVTFWPSEFSQVRAQYRRTDYADVGVANELLAQVLFTIGAHGAHPF